MTRRDVQNDIARIDCATIDVNQLLLVVLSGKEILKSEKIILER